MRRLLTIAAVGGATLLATNQTETLDFAAGPGGRLQLKVDKTGLLSGKSHLFTFERFTGEIHFDANDPVRSSVSLQIDAASTTCRDTWLSAKDLKKVQAYAVNDMLSAREHPTVSFVSTSARALSPGRFEVRGTLTIRGIARPASVDVTVESRQAFRGTAKVRLTDFGLKPPSAALGTIGTKSEMELTFEITAHRRSGTN